MDQSTRAKSVVAHVLLLHTQVGNVDGTLLMFTYTLMPTYMAMPLTYMAVVMVYILSLRW